MANIQFSDEEIGLFLDGEASADLVRSITKRALVDAKLAERINTFRMAQLEFTKACESMLVLAPPSPKTPQMNASRRIKTTVACTILAVGMTLAGTAVWNETIAAPFASQMAHSELLLQAC